MKKKKIVLYLLVLIFLLVRLFHLTKLPIFADEAIYIRWAMMIFHDPKQFLFLPLYDGKTPLFIWALIPLVKLFSYDPLFGARLLSTIFGLSTFFAVNLITKRLKGTPFARLVSGIIISLLPYTLFHDRMGLIDSAVTSWLGWSVYFYLSWRDNQKLNSILLTGVFWGFALLTKTTAFYFIPVFGGWWAWDVLTHRDWRTWKQVWHPAVAFLIGMSFIGWMRISPLLPFLFRRSSDFAFTIQEIISKPFFIISLNAPKIGMWWWSYLTPVALLILLLGIYLKKSRASVIYMLLGLLLSTTPFLMTGKLLASRYLLPGIIFIVPSMSLAFDALRTVNKHITTGLLVVFIGWCLWFDYSLWFSPGTIAFTQDDVRQYLSDWSAGYGIPETRDYLRSRVALGKRVVIGTEGYFGTLPDGLFIYFSETPQLASMEIFGVGQPLVGTPPQLRSKMSLYDETYMLVNENRISYDYLNDFELVERYQKPHNGPPLLLLRMKP